MIWSRRQLAALAKQSATSLRRIEDLIAKQVSTVNGKEVWGQFLDQAHAENQYGIYGTSAAVQILALGGTGPENGTVKSAMAALQNVIENQSAIFPAVDLENSFKVAYLLDAINPSSAEVESLGPLESRLVGDIAGSDGWGYHRKDHIPRVLPTAQILLALSRSRAFRNSDAAIRVVSWLSQRVGDDQSLGPVPNAVALLAINATLTANGEAERLRRAAMAEITQRLDHVTRQEVSLDSVSEHYSAPEAGVTRHFYMFYLRSSLVARAMLALPDQKDKSFVTQVCHAVVRNIEINGAFKSPSTNRISTVDQLEVSRLLRAFLEARQQAPAELLPTLTRAVDSNAKRRTLAASGLTVVGAAGGYLTYASESAGLQTAGFVLSAVVLSIAGAAIWGWTGTKS
jgi:hypothetical protein